MKASPMLSPRRTLALLLCGSALAAGSAAQAQRLDYADLDGPAVAPLDGEAEAAGGGDSPDELGAGDAAPGEGRGGGAAKRKARRTGFNTAHASIRPYLEVNQTVFTELRGAKDTFTYSTVAAGVDADLTGRSTKGAVSVRYERRISQTKSRVGDADIISGIGRVKQDLIPRTLAVEAGGLAVRTRVDPTGGSALDRAQAGDTVSQVYSAYAGPALTTNVGDVAVNANYLAGYTRVKGSNRGTLAPGQTRQDIFSSSVTQSANLSASTKANGPLPVGLGAAAGYTREDVRNLDQRVEDFHALGEVAVPLGDSVQVIGGVGYENVKVSARDALRNPDGTPVVDGTGRFVTDKSSPRRLAYDTSGVIWEAGVLWKPSRRTSLSAYVGRRYGGTTYWGSFNYAPDRRSVLNVSVFQGITGFGGSLTNALAGLPLDGAIARNPFNGSIGGCTTGSESGGCVNGALSSVNSAVFRTTGVGASYGVTVGNLRGGIGGGYVRRRYVTTTGSVLGALNGTVDQDYYLSTSLSGEIDRSSRFATSVYIDWFDSGVSPLGDTRTVGANAAYFRNITDHLQGNFAVTVDGIDRKVVDDSYVAAALVGLRYNF